MRYLCLIHVNGEEISAMPEAELGALNARHLEFNARILKSGHFIEAEALQPPASASCVRRLDGKVSVTDGPFAETEEMVGGFYLIEARDLNEAIQVASRIPCASLWTVEVRPCRDLEVSGVAHRASSKSR